MIILDGKKIEDFGFFVEPGQEDPLTPSFENKTIAIPDRPGLYNFGTEIRERPLSFNLRIMERFHDRMQSAFDELVAFLLDDFGRPRELKLIRDYEFDKFLTVKVSQELIPERLVDEGTLTLPFIAYDPYRYSNVYADEVTWGSEVITFEYNYLLGHEGTTGNNHIGGNSTINLTVSGLAIKPLITIEGSANNLRLEVNGYEINFPNFTDTTWKIDCKGYTVLKNGVNNFNDVKLRDFILLSGKNEVNITGSNLDIDINFRFRDKY